ncbi:FAD-binding oxidoreductase [Nocardia sp. NBC_00508]|uniref:FAD-binding oxidoreductase n=1 Tax=Nocardia sp. NBC_00508 TaxID=2975992 RepID=UPI002E81047D|nr:FAD-binding oxidoreductase [Nocardia sp. NBC_00508]WUD64868.1 FAD-binding oxidoreductase [Nocardia sp. NBC_00508]
MDVPALRDSWLRVEKVGDEAVLYFYSHLFMTHPEVRDLFPVSMAAQRGKFLAALGRIVSNVDRVAADPTFVRQLGRDHRKFEVVADHYPAAGASLLATLQYFLGAEWSDSLASDWAEAYHAVAQIMMMAAEEDEESVPAWWEAEVIATERRGIDVGLLRIRPTQPYGYIAGQSMAVEVPQRPRLWRYYTPANAPRPDGTLDLHVQIVAGGQVSATLARTVAVGDTLRLAAPIGTALTLPADFRGDLLMVAGGTGLAPMTALIEQLDESWRTTGEATNVHLFHGVRTQWSMYDHAFLSELAGTRPWLRYTPVVSDDPAYPGARGLVGTVAAQTHRWQGETALICGSAAMVEHAAGELRRAGLPDSAIRFENLDGRTPEYTTPNTSAAPAEIAHEVAT